MGLLRVLLALSVVLSHFGGFFGYYIAGGFASVQMFYVVSGFYMATILTEKYDPRRDIGIFFTNRFLRIYSIYFLCLLISLIGYAIIYFSGQGGWVQYIKDIAPTMTWWNKAWLVFTGLFIFGQESTLFLTLEEGNLVFTPDGPVGDMPIWNTMPVPQAWSISLELMFYCLVPFLIRHKTRTLVALIAASLVGRAAMYHAGYASDPWLSRFFPFELGLFVMGMVSRRIYDAYIDKIEHKTQIIVVASFFVFTFILYELISLALAHDLTESHVVWFYYFSALIALPCLFHLTRYNKLDGAIGNFSYPVYLVHWIVLKFYEAFAGKFDWPGPETWGKTVICVIVTFFLAWLIVIGIDTPIDRFRQRRAAAALAN